MSPLVVALLAIVDLGASSVSDLAHAVAVAVGDDDVAVVEQPVPHRKAAASEMLQSCAITVGTGTTPVSMLE
jgi:hypothetical protein